VEEFDLGLGFHQSVEGSRKVGETRVNLSHEQKVSDLVNEFLSS